MVVAPWQTWYTTSKATGKLLIKRKYKSEFRQTLKTLNVRIQKSTFEKKKIKQFDAGEEKQVFPWHFPIFYISLPFCLWLKRGWNLSFLEWWFLDFLVTFANATRSVRMGCR